MDPAVKAVARTEVEREREREWDASSRPARSRHWTQGSIIRWKTTSITYYTY